MTSASDKMIETITGVLLQLENYTMSDAGPPTGNAEKKQATGIGTQMLFSRRRLLEKEES